MDNSEIMEFPPFWREGLIEGLTTEMVKKAEDELGETDVVKEQALKDLRLLIKREGKNFHPLMEDACLLCFLRYSKYNVKRAFSTLITYYTMKKRYSGVITDFTPSDIMDIIDRKIIYPLPRRLPDGLGIGIYKPGCYDINSGSAEYFLRACVLCWYMAAMSEATQVCGSAGVVDMRNFSLSHLKKFSSPTFLYRIARFAQNCVPLRIKAVHVVNEPPFISGVFNILKRFLSEKMSNRIHFHGDNLTSLHRFIPKEILPEELGGTEAIDHQELRDEMLKHEAYFEKLKEYGYRDITP